MPEKLAISLKDELESKETETGLTGEETELLSSLINYLNSNEDSPNLDFPEGYGL